MTKHAGGRPPKLTREQRSEVWQALARYIELEDDPTIVGFCAYDETAHSYLITKDNIHDWAEFSELRKLAIQKQEAYLLRKGTKGSLSTTMAIFRLKQPQHGYTDRQEIQHSGDGGIFGANALTIKVVDGRDNSQSQAETGV